MMEPEIVEPEQPQVDEPLEKPRKEKKPRKPPTENQLAALARGRELRAKNFKVVPKEEPKPDPKPVEEPEPEPPKRAYKPRVKKERIVYYADSDEEEDHYVPQVPKRVVKARAEPPQFSLQFV